MNTNDKIIDVLDYAEALSKNDQDMLEILGSAFVTHARYYYKDDKQYRQVMTSILEEAKKIS